MTPEEAKEQRKQNLLRFLEGQMELARTSTEDTLWPQVEAAMVNDGYRAGVEAALATIKYLHETPSAKNEYARGMDFGFTLSIQAVQCLISRKEEGE